jgi:hypothetical protein
VENFDSAPNNHSSGGLAITSNPYLLELLPDFHRLEHASFAWRTISPIMSSRGALMFLIFARPLGALREVLSEEIFAACQFEAAIHLSNILLGYGSGLPPGT